MISLELMISDPEIKLDPEIMSSSQIIKMKRQQTYSVLDCKFALDHS